MSIRKSLSSENILNKSFRRWNRVAPTFGHLDFSAFFIAVVSGIIITVPYDVNNPSGSIQEILLTDESASFFRSIHYWSAQFFLIFVLLHIIEYFLIGREEKITAGSWLRITLSLPAIIYVMLSGYILKGDAEGTMALRIFAGLLENIPFIGSQLGTFLLGPGSNMQVIYIHHAATATIFIWIVIAEHVRLFWPRLIPLAYIFSTSVLLAVFVPAPLTWSSYQGDKGPWYFVGFQEILHWISRPGIAITAFFIFLSIFFIIPRVEKKWRSRLKIAMLFLLISYGAFSAAGWFFRGENWLFILPWSR